MSRKCAAPELRETPEKKESWRTITIILIVGPEPFTTFENNSKSLSLLALTSDPFPATAAFSKPA
jgi:hypothetical protein